MDEQEFDALFQSRPFRTEDAMREDARWRRCATLAGALFGRSADDLRRQLLASHPQIPSGFDLDDFRDLQRHLQLVSGALTNPRNVWLSPHLSLWGSENISVGTQRFTAWEARSEIVRRAIEYLENR
jgi:hypothetical protein